IVTPQLEPPTPPPHVTLRTLAHITGQAEQRLWLDTITAMEQEAGASPDELGRIRDWILHGISLQFDSVPETVEYSNTPSVLHNAEVVRTRLQQYMDFNAVIQLPPDHPCPY